MRWSWPRSRAISTTSATWSTASTTPRAGRSWPSVSWTTCTCPPEEIADDRHRHRQPRRGHRQCPSSPVAAALILADKSDVRRSRVRNQDKTHLRHPRPGELFRHQVRAEDQRGARPSSSSSCTSTRAMALSWITLRFSCNRMILCRQGGGDAGPAIQAHHQRAAAGVRPGLTKWGRIDMIKTERALLLAVGPNR